VALSLARALHFLHRHGIAHLGVSPACVLLAPDGAARLGDLGAARLLGPHTRPADPARPAAALARGYAATLCPGHFLLVAAQQEAGPAKVVLGWSCGALARESRAQRAPALCTLAPRATAVPHRCLGTGDACARMLEPEVGSGCDTRQA